MTHLMNASMEEYRLTSRNIAFLNNGFSSMELNNTLNETGQVRNVNFESNSFDQ
jgi:hypothetical protein